MLLCVLHDIYIYYMFYACFNCFYSFINDLVFSYFELLFYFIVALLFVPPIHHLAVQLPWRACCTDDDARRSHRSAPPRLSVAAPHVRPPARARATRRD